MNANKRPFRRPIPLWPFAIAIVLLFVIAYRSQRVSAAIYHAIERSTLPQLGAQ